MDLKKLRALEELRDYYEEYDKRFPEWLKKSRQLA